MTWRWRPFACVNCGETIRGDALRCHACGMEYEYDELDAESQHAEDEEMQGNLFAGVENGPNEL